MVKDIKIASTGSPVRGSYMVTNMEFKPFANKPGTFLALELTDLSGSIKAIMWDPGSCKDWLMDKMVVTVQGELNFYKDVPQVLIKSLAIQKDYKPEDFLPSLSAEALNAIKKEFSDFQKTIQCELYKSIWTSIMSSKNYFTCPGGVGDVHHNYIGGLAEHSLSIMRLIKAMKVEIQDEARAQNFDLDVAYTGALVHDIGKLKAYDWDGVIMMTDQGRLLHHTNIGFQIISDMVHVSDRTSPEFLQIAHIIVSHHHDDEGGRKPMTPEALAVAYLDNADAQVAFTRAYMNNSEYKGNWTKFCQMTGRSYYRNNEPPF